MLREGDGLLFYVSKPVHGIIGSGIVRTKFRQNAPLWPEEVKRGQVLWPLRFEFDVEYCLSPSLWESRKYTSEDLQLITRMVFQCYPMEEVEAARKGLGLEAAYQRPVGEEDGTVIGEVSDDISHAGLKQALRDIGRVQGYVAEEEYKVESTFLDVVWRRVARSVPTYVFEVQMGGDIYHAMAKLKRAHELWNSHIFLVAGLSERSKYEELVSGIFREVEGRVRFIDAGAVKNLLEKKVAYKTMEEKLGILAR
jgi:hypothetical protein